MLALIAGRGGLPAAVAGAQDTPPYVCALNGFLPDDVPVDRVFRLETIGTLIHDLSEMGVTQVCFCGAIDRPKVDPAHIDAATAPLVPVVSAAIASGEDGGLRAIMGLFETAGMTARAAHDLAPGLVLPAGQPTRAKAPQGAGADVQTALGVLASQGVADVGQACIVHAGQVRAREDARGTDAMLASLTARATPFLDDGDPVSDMMDMAGDALGLAADWLSGDPARAGLLFKAPKPGQDLRLDLPTIGATTAKGAVDAGLAGIVIAAGGVIVLDQAEVIDILDNAGMYLWVR
ncbi:MAG: UDP-2,3-diacylglucosamine diphosphatase LpxI [Pseudomonadota bacterium]